MVLLCSTQCGGNIINYLQTPRTITTDQTKRGGQIARIDSSTNPARNRWDRDKTKLSFRRV